jgi:peptidoglycan/LPS O-acetylase OafA/YrhL
MADRASILVPAERADTAYLTGVRGLAIAYVLVSHAGNAGLMLIPGVETGATGKVGVWLFFVLSAYLLTAKLVALLEARPDTWSTELFAYGIHRVFRIYPMLIVVVLLHFAIGNLDGHAVVRHLFLAEGRQELWAIPVEFKYYLVIPVLAAIHVRFGSGVSAAVVAAALSVSIGLSSWVPQQVFDNGLQLATRLAPFLLGSAAALWQRRAGTPRTGAIAAVSMAAAALLATFALHEVLLRPSFVTLAPIVSLALALVWATLTLLAANNRTVRRVFSHPMIVYTGTISFSLYLLHMFLIDLMVRVPFGPAPLRGWLVLALSFVLASITYRVVEAPGIRVGRFLGDSLRATRPVTDAST